MEKLTLSKQCQKCGKSNCDILYFDKIRKEWNCKNCTEYLKKKDK